MWLCQVLMLQGRIEDALEFFEGRFNWTPPTPIPAVPLPRWKGGPVGSLLVVAEQGLGDQIQFARYLPQIPNATVVVEPALARLFAQFGHRIVTPGQSGRISDFDAWTPICSLGHLVGGLPGTPYLKAEASRSGGVGICWKGRPSHPNDANRSMSGPELLMSLPGAMSLHPEDTGAKDMMETAEIVAGLDLVVSVDTSVVHLAGALGKPCWVLLPALHADWRWTAADRTPWYNTVRVFRQNRPGDWRSALDAVRLALSAS